MLTDFTRKAIFPPLLVGSLNLLALLLFYQRLKEIPVAPRSISHYLPSENREHLFNGWHTLDTYREKQPFIFKLNGSSADSRSIQAIMARAEIMKEQRDTSHYVRIMLSEEIKYQDIVSLINIMIKDGHKRYMMWQNSFYIFPAPKEDRLSADVVPVLPVFID
jgi:hypothetical protein